MNTAKLKAAAEKATPGPWRRTATIFNGITCGPFSLSDEKVLANVAEKANAEFIAAANPAAVLELIAALEAAQKRIAELEARTVKLPPCVDDLHGVGMVMSADAVTEALSEAGINLETGGEA